LIREAKKGQLSSLRGEEGGDEEDSRTPTSKEDKARGTANKKQEGKVCFPYWENVPQMTEEKRKMD